MLKAYDYPEFEFHQSADQKSGAVKRHPVVIVGGGPVGLSAAIDLAVQGMPVVVLDEDKTVSIGSRAVCYAKRALEIWDRLGCAGPMVDKGVIWKTGKVFRHDREIYQFDLLPEDGHKMHFPQLPDEDGWDVNATQPQVLADDWTCSQTGWVKDIHFWGSWQGGDAGLITGL